MTDIYRQTVEILKPPVPKPSLFWNPRGRVIKVQDNIDVTKLIRTGFVRCTENVKEGDYNPVFDKGNEINDDQVVQEAIKLKTVNANNLKLIKV